MSVPAPVPVVVLTASDGTRVELASGSDVFHSAFLRHMLEHRTEDRTVHAQVPVSSVGLQLALCHWPASLEVELDLDSVCSLVQAAHFLGCDGTTDYGLYEPSLDLQRYGGHLLLRWFRGRNSTELRQLLGIAQDLSEDIVSKSMSEPLFTAPSILPPIAEPVPMRRCVLSKVVDLCGGEDAIIGALTGFDARTLSTLKGVSSYWRQRARAALCSPQFVARPTWAEPPLGAALILSQGLLEHRSPHARFAALVALGKLNPYLELPGIVHKLIDRLKDPEKFVRALALQHIRDNERALSLTSKISTFTQAGARPLPCGTGEAGE